MGSAVAEQAASKGVRVAGAMSKGARVAGGIRKGARVAGARINQLITELRSFRRRSWLRVRGV